MAFSPSVVVKRGDPLGPDQAAGKLWFRTSDQEPETPGVLIKSVPFPRSGPTPGEPLPKNTGIRSGEKTTTTTQTKTKQTTGDCNSQRLPGPASSP